MREGKFITLIENNRDSMDPAPKTILEDMYNIPCDIRLIITKNIILSKINLKM